MVSVASPLVGPLVACIALSSCQTPSVADARPSPAAKVSTTPPTPLAAPAERSPATLTVLRVCADPNNLPFSHRSGEGFENRLAELFAKALKLELSYTWWPQRRGFLRNTLNAGRCDVVMSLPVGFERVLTSEPVYRSSYVLVLGAGAPRIRSLDDARLASQRIGVPLVGDDGANPAPVLALAARRLTDNLRGYPVYDRGSADGRAVPLLQAVERGDVDLAVAWGPLAGYYASRASSPLELVPLSRAEAPPNAPFTFEMALAVRKSDRALLDRLNGVLEQRRAEVNALLDSFHFPRNAEQAGGRIAGQRPAPG